MVTQQAGAVSSSGSGVLLSGTVPPLADAYYPREQSGPDLASSMGPGETVVLIHGEETAQAPAAQGGTGKTQLAVEFTHAMWNTRAVEILIWVNAASRESVITGFAQAANTVDASQLDVGEDLDGLPLALAQATAAMSARGQGCREYRALLAERIGHMPAAAGVSAAVLATWSIAAECAHELPPAGLAWPTLVLAAMLDYHGIPGAVLTSPAACSYIAGRPSTANAADQNMIRAAINNLAQAGLVTIDPVSPVRTVQMHASVQAAVRAYLPAADLEQVVPSAADALLETWPDGDVAGQRGQWAEGQVAQAQLEQALRDCAATLRTSD